MIHSIQEQIPSSMSPSVKSALDRLEVETTASTSSFDSQASQYYQDNIKSEPPISLDTFSLLNEQENQGRYSNTLHINSPTRKQQITRTSTCSSVIRHPPQEIINPVPQRFSQFILDQKKPLDGMSIESPRTSDYEYKGTIQSKLSKRFTRDISDSMGSQATIFSTKIDPNLVPLIDTHELMTSNIRRKRRQLFKRSSTQRTSNVKLYGINSETSSLKRTNAIRFKQGGWIYRLKCKLKKLFRFKFFNFKVSSKRLKSIKRINSSSFKKLIGNPVTNPQLGKTPVFKVSKIDQRIIEPQPQPQEETKLTRLSEYIYHQEHTYLTNLTAKSESIHASEPKSRYAEAEVEPEVEPQPRSLDPKLHNKPQQEQSVVEQQQQQQQQQPPAPPPHTDNSYIENQRILSNLHTLPQVWNNYLLTVLTNRIKLRQEITMFQKFMIDKDMSNSLTTYFETESKFSESVRSDSRSKSSYEEDVVSLATTSNYSSIDSETPNEEFDRKVLHRRSMLGEMLEYSSEEEEEEEEEDTLGYSKSCSTILSKTYGTINRKPTITRSFGISHSLNDLTVV